MHSSKKLTTIAAAVALSWVLARSAAAIPPELASGQKTEPKDSDAYSLVGAPLAKVFETFQTPMDMTAADADTKTPGVCLDYGPFGYIFRDNKITACIFWANWKGTIAGISFAQTSDEIIEKLGKPTITLHAADGTEKLIWTLKDKDRDLDLMLEFDKDKKLERAVVRPLKQQSEKKPDDKKLESEKKQESQQKQESQK